MDKACVIGDAVQYVHDLQAKANKLKDEVSRQETSLLMSENYQGSINKHIKVHTTHNSYPICEKIMQLPRVKVFERRRSPIPNDVTTSYWLETLFGTDGFHPFSK
ncbi:unnamed protein product [Lupinus luteus]|uniref:Uncharacterized protein n=1 Tax=Lupinus luteus TaxID=3873 RepID=A0AAV1XKS1_LUPLU